MTTVVFPIHWKESYVLKLDYLIRDSFVTDQKTFESVSEEISGFQNKKNPPRNTLCQNLLGEKNSNFEIGENTSNSEIQLGDLFEDFIRELEKEIMKVMERDERKADEVEEFKLKNYFHPEFLIILNP